MFLQDSGIQVFRPQVGNVLYSWHIRDHDKSMIDQLLHVKELQVDVAGLPGSPKPQRHGAVSYKHLRAHETKAKLGCRLLLEKKKLKLYIKTFRFA